MLDELSLLDDVVSSDDESTNDASEFQSGVENNQIPNRSFLHPGASKSKQKKSEKLSEIIYGCLNQPFRALSAHPYITCDLISNGQRICPPQQSQYRQMTNRYEYVILYLKLSLYQTLFLQLERMACIFSYNRHITT